MMPVPRTAGQFGKRQLMNSPKARPDLMRRLLRLTGVDANVGWTFLARLASMLAGFVSLFPVIHFLSATQQGYYYTFASIIALQVLFELGLTQILVQVTSHEFPFLPEDVPVSGLLASPHGRRLAFFARFAERWYLSVSGLFVTVVSVAGGVYFHRFGTLPSAQWLAPWVCLIGLTGINLYLSPRLAFVEGAGFPGKVAALRLAQTLIGYTLLMAMLWAGLGLWAVVALPLTQVALSLRWLVRDRSVPNFFHRDVRRGDKAAVQEPGWRREILDLQWRVALSWVGGYLAMMVFTPLLFAYQGAVVAGRWGLTFSLMSQLSALGTSWTTARAPRFGELIARGDRGALDRAFRDASIKTVALLAVACLALIAAVWSADWLGLAFVDRIVGVVDIALMSGATIAAGVVFCMAIYVRAHKEEPLVASSLVIGGLTALSAWITARYGITAVALAYLAVTVVVNLPWRWHIYLRYRDRRIDQPTAAT